MGYFIYAILWLATAAADVVFLLSHFREGVPFIEGVPLGLAFEPLVVANLLVLVLRPDAPGD